MPEPVRLAFLGCGFITRVHSRHLRALRGDVIWSYASRDVKKAVDFCGRYRRRVELWRLPSAIADSHVDAVVIAVPPRFHLDLTLAALEPASTCWSRSPRSPTRPTTAPCSTRATARDASSWLVKTITTSRWRTCLRRLLARRRARRDGVRAVHDHREEAEDGRRLAQRRDDGRRRRVLRGRDSLAAPGRQSRPGDHHGARLPAVDVAPKVPTGVSRA